MSKPQNPTSLLLYPAPSCAKSPDFVPIPICHCNITKFLSLIIKSTSLAVLFVYMLLFAHYCGYEVRDIRTAALRFLRTLRRACGFSETLRRAGEIRRAVLSLFTLRRAGFHSVLRITFLIFSLKITVQPKAKIIIYLIFCKTNSINSSKIFLIIYQVNYQI